jgi:Tol biopolymer transport system component
MQILLKSSTTELYDSPAFSPDGTDIVFIARGFDATGRQVDEIRAIGSDGKQLRTVFKTPANGSPLFFGYPTYAPDRSVIYFSLIQIAGGQVSQLQITRGQPKNGAWQIVMSDGYQAALSRDG